MTDVNSILVSVVVPTRDRAEKLGRCLESLAAQSYPNFEVLVVDDGSRDNTQAVLDSVERGFPGLNLRRFAHHSPKGANPARNLAIQHAHGELVAFLDNDCYAQANWLAALVSGFTDQGVGAVTGIVEDAPPQNLFDLTFQGTHRVHGRFNASRLIAGNMCVRRQLVERFLLDEDRASAAENLRISGRGDEDGLFLRIRAAGYRQLVAHDAVVVHHHSLTGRSFFRQACRSGSGAARLAYKYRLPPRAELASLILAWMLLPMIFVHRWGWALSALLAGVSLAAIVYNDLFRKRKRWWQTLVTLPLLVAYYHARAWGYLVEWIRIAGGSRRIERVNLRQQDQAALATQKTTEASNQH